MKANLYFFVLSIIIGFLSLSVPADTFYRNQDFVSINELQDRYSSVVKPLLDRRCVVCHSCTEAPCQLKLESPEGLERGASKVPARGGIFFSRTGRRLFYDAATVKEWRDKQFYSVIEPSTLKGSGDASIMLKALVEGHNSKTSPPRAGEDQDFGSIGGVAPMPFNLAPLDYNDEFIPLVKWLQSGAPMPSEADLETIKKPKRPDIIEKWEAFFNDSSFKGKWTARYLYEHLFETHFYIDEAPGEFFEIVRSKTKYPEKIQIISTTHATKAPWPTPLLAKKPVTGTFYYRLRKIHSSIVFKNHILYHVNDQKLADLKKLFWNSKWEQTETQEFNFEQTNPFVAFKHIPAKVRYTWMLENAEMLFKVIMSGPNCRISPAGSMIWDNYLVFFLKPEADASVTYPDYFEKTVLNLPIPNLTGGKQRLLSQYNKEQLVYSKIKMQYLDQLRPKGFSNSDLWTGEGKDTNSLISVFRHIDYASAHAGHWVAKPRAAHLFDYATYERLYYLCVVATATTDSSVAQVSVVRYLFDLKKELDEQFLSLVPEEHREKIRASYVEPKGKKYDYDIAIALPFNEDNKIEISAADPLQSTIDNLLKSVFNAKILGNHSSLKQSDPEEEKLETLSTIGGGVASHFPEIMYLKVIQKNGQSSFYTMLANRYHSFLNRIQTDKKSWDPKRDTFEIISGIQIDFVDKVFVVDEDKIDDFIEDVKAVSNREKYLEFDVKYAVQRQDARFWSVIDEIQAYFHQSNPIGAGLLDLHKYGRFDDVPPSY